MGVRPKKIALGELIIPLVAAGYVVYNLAQQVGARCRPSTLRYSILLAIPILGCVAIIIGRVLVAAGLSKESTKEPEPRTLARNYKKLILSLVEAFILVFLLDWVGYILGFFGFLVLALLIMGVRSIGKILAISVAMVVLVYFIFARLLSLPLPLGILKGLF